MDVVSDVVTQEINLSKSERSAEYLALYAPLEALRCVLFTLHQ